MEYAVGVDIGGTKIHFAIVNQQGETVIEEIVATEAKLGAEHVMQKVLDGIERLLQRNAEQETPLQLEGIGIGSAGQINFATGEVAFAVDTLPGWTGMPIRQRVEDQFKMRVIVDNDVNVIAIAEKCFGAGLNHQNYVCLALGTGVGGALVESGELIRGVFGGAGELGHISVNFNGPRCSCGNYGCIELYASGTGIARLAKEYIEQHAPEVNWTSDSREVVAAWLQGDAHAAVIMNEMFAALSSTIAGLIHTLNPEAIVIGGGISEVGEVFFDTLRNEVAKRTSPRMWEVCSIIPAKVGKNSGVIGAAAQIWHYSS